MKIEFKKKQNNNNNKHEDISPKIQDIKKFHPRL